MNGLRQLFDFLGKIYSHRVMIMAMARQNLKRQYAGTFGGFLWHVIHPLMTILVFWLIFSAGLKVQPMENAPFIVVFCCGYIPWMTFSQTLSVSTSIIVDNSHLTTKTVFPTEILPIVSLIANLMGHGILMCIFLLLLFFNQIPFSLWNLQFIYYLFSLSVLTISLGWFLSAVNVFFRDVGQIFSIILNLWFWMTPIVWPVSIVPEKYRFILDLNPVYYIVKGYKLSFIDHVPFWHNLTGGLYFWALCSLVLLIGSCVFRKLKPEFAELL
ncbi:MAG: ABC transporter permease [Desulfobacteraceae bacterium]|nr:ABC transporter permease [Desulfobacteraceae bacterium]